MSNFWRTGAPRILKIQWFPLSILIFGQNFCFLGPTIFKIPQPNWYYSKQCSSSSTWTEFLSHLRIIKDIGWATQMEGDSFQACKLGNLTLNYDQLSHAPTFANLPFLPRLHQPIFHFPLSTTAKTHFVMKCEYRTLTYLDK